MASQKEKEQTIRCPIQRIVKAARSLFLKHGVSGVSTDMLAAQAQTSKMTMYKYFPDKMSIFKAFLEAECERLYDLDVALPDAPDTFVQTLREFGVALLELLSDPDIVRFDQVMLSQATTHPELTQFFYQHSYQATCNQLQRLIAHGQSHGWIELDEEPELLSHLLVSGWKHTTYQKALYSVCEAEFAQKQAHVQRVIRLVLRLEAHKS